MQVARFSGTITDYSVKKCAMNTENSGTSLDEAIKLSSTYFDDKAKE
jgi:hypothetical protein